MWHRGIFAHANAAQKQDGLSDEEYFQAQKEHQKESELKLKAIKDYLKLFKNQLSFWQEFY